MSSILVSGTEGYGDETEALFERFERVSFADLHKQVLDLIPATPSRVLDIGSGSGRDAAAFATMGHSVVAVEPTDGLRERAAAAHPSPRIEWLDDSLPALTRLTEAGESFDAVMATAVWMHLDAKQRGQAMARVEGLMRSGGIMILTLRHGPVPPGRRMFDVSAQETEQLAAAGGLRLALKFENQGSVSGQKGVQWTRLAFSKA